MTQMRTPEHQEDYSRPTNTQTNCPYRPQNRKEALCQGSANLRRTDREQDETSGEQLPRGLLRLDRRDRSRLRAIIKFLHSGNIPYSLQGQQNEMPSKVHVFALLKRIGKM
jgi:hypothetical protein